MRMIIAVLTMLTASPTIAETWHCMPKEVALLDGPGTASKLRGRQVENGLLELTIDQESREATLKVCATGATVIGLSSGA